MTLTILTASGSLRAASCHTALLTLARRLAGPDLAVADPYPIGELPFYNDDFDQPGLEPAPVLAWRAAIAAADAVLFACPEYNYGPTPVLKNAFDWATRPFGKHPMKGKPLAIIGGGGKGGGVNVQEYFERIAPALGCVMANEPQIAIANIRDEVNPDGTVKDPNIEAAVSARLAALAALTGSAPL